VSFSSNGVLSSMLDISVNRSDGTSQGLFSKTEVKMRKKNDGKPQRRWDGGDNVASHLFRAYTPKREQRDFDLDMPNFNYFRLLV